MNVPTVVAPRRLQRWAWACVALVACGAAASESVDDSTNGGDVANGGDVVQDDGVVVGAADEVDPQVCANDADCMVGTPRNCCASFCPSDTQAWSRSAWAEYQDECAIVECAVVEDAACLPETPPRVEARCVDARCVLAVGAE